MIGVIPHEDGTVFEFWPIFGSERGIPRWAQLRTKLILSDKYWGEYGISFSWKGRKTWKHWDIWVEWGNWCHPRDWNDLMRWIKSLFKRKER